YGIFTAVHGAFVMLLFGGGFPGRAEAAAPAPDLLFDRIWMNEGLVFGAAALFMSHLASFLLNFLRGREIDRATLPQLMGAPYGRVIILHMTILLGSFFVMATGEAVWALI